MKSIFEWIVLLLAALVGLIWFAARPIMIRIGRLPSVPTFALPSHVHLVPLKPRWEYPREIEKSSRDVSGLGFQEIGTFAVPDLLCSMRAYLSAKEKAYAIVSETPATGSWIDICANFEDGISLTVTNNPMSGVIDNPPWEKKIHMRNANAHKLMERFHAEVKDAHLRDVSATSFTATFEDESARWVAWRRERGPTSEEIRRVAKRSNNPASEETIEGARRLTRYRELKQQRIEEDAATSKPNEITTASQGLGAVLKK